MERGLIMDNVNNTLNKLYIVYNVDTEGPLFESLEETFNRLYDIYGIELNPTEENLRKIQNQELDFGGREGEVANAFSRNLLNYNDTVEVYKNNIGIVDKLSEIYGFETLYYWQPVIFTKPKLSLYEQKEEKKYGYYKSFYLDTYSRVENDSMLNQHGRFRNISNIFENDSNPYFTDSVHITSNGNKVISDRMLGDIVELMDVSN